MRLEEPSVETVGWVAANMREWDRREIYATRLDDSVDAFVSDVMRAGPIFWTAGIELPIAVFGVAPMWRGVWSMWFFATNEIDKIGLGATRLIVRDIVPMMWGLGAHRLECKSMEGHTEAQRWLATLGARRESTQARYGRNGEDFHTYVWDRP